MNATYKCYDIKTPRNTVSVFFFFYSMILRKTIEFYVIL